MKIKTSKYIKKHPIHPLCEKCRLNCTNKFTGELCIKINNEYCNKNWIERRNFKLLFMQVGSKTKMWP